MASIEREIDELLPEIDIPDSKLVLIMRWTPLPLLLGSIIVIFSLNIETRIFDIIASYLPLSLMLLAGGVIFMTYLYGRFIIRNSWEAFLQIIDTLDVLILAFLLITTSYLFYMSQTAVTVYGISPELKERMIEATTMNMWVSSTDISGAQNYIKQTNPDLIGLQEVRPAEVEALRKSLNYQYISITDCDCSAHDTEVALISKFPLKNVHKIAEHGSQGAILRATAITEQGPLETYVVHLPPPFSQDWYDVRTVMFQRLKDDMAEISAPILVMGDFNTAVYSPIFRDFERSTTNQVDYTTSRVWPRCSFYGLSDLFCVRIDHIFIPKRANLHSIEIGQPINSDHRPVSAQFSIER